MQQSLQNGLSRSVQAILHWYYTFVKISTIPQTNQHRDNNIRQRYANGETLEDLARAYGISFQRIHQIIKQHG
jgi:Mor family transcriptional regulator